MSEAYLCATCGVQYSESEQPPDRCQVCDDERQFVPPGGQRWLTLDELRSTHRNAIRALEPGLTSLCPQPSLAMGHQALLVESEYGNVLWDCISLLDDETVEAVRALGGISAIAISHPHFYDTMVEWSRAFDDCPVYLNEADRDWVMRPDPCLLFWSGPSFALNDEMTLVHCGGHYRGAAVLHWPAGAGGHGVLLTGDTIAPMMRPEIVSFMYSFPNMIPLSAAQVRRIVEAIEPYRFDRLYGLWADRVVGPDAESIVQRSAERYLEALAQP